MNTHDIELPPLPPLCIAPSVEPVDYPKIAQALMDYARTAVEADRQQRESIVTDDMRSAIRFAPFSAYWSDVLRDIFGPDAREGIDALERRLRDIEDDRQRRGEPYAQLIVLDEDDAWPQLVYLKGVNLATGVHNLYLTPQPAESVNHSIQDCPEDDKWNCKYCKRVNSCPVQGYRYAQPVESMKTLIDNQEPLGEEFQKVLDDNRWDLYMKGGEPVKVNAIFETQDGEVIGTTNAKVKRVEWQDDGSLTVVIDHWPQSAELMRCKGCGYLVTDMEHQICVKAAQLTEPESCFCDRMYPDSNPDASCGDCPIRDYGVKTAEPDSVKCAECGADLIPVRPGKWQHPDCSQNYWADEPVSKTDWNNELSSWSDEDFIRIFHERPDLANRLRKMLAEPVKGVIYGPNGFIATTTNPDPVKVDVKASVPSPFPVGTEYSVKPHGNGYAIYQGRDKFHHGLNLAYLTECTPEFSKRIESALNATREPVVADAPVPSDESTRKWKRIEEYSREVDGKKIDIYLGDFLLYCPELEDEENSGVVIGYYSESYRGWYTSDEKVFPTHFMPLPEKPL